MNSNEAKEIFLHVLPEVSGALNSAINFVLTNWHKLTYEPRASDVAINFFASLPALPSNIIDETFAAKLNKMAKLLRDTPDIWLSFEDLPHEEWCAVVDYEKRYQVSNYGRVKSLLHKYPRIMRADVQSKGYVQIRLFKNGRPKNFGVHVLVAKAFILNPERKPEVDHINGDKENNCIWNLNWTTRSENASRAYQLGLIKVCRGTQSRFAKLGADEVIYIKDNPDSLTTKELMKKFDVCKETIRRIRIGKTYKDVIR